MAKLEKPMCPDMTKTPIFYIRNRDLVPAQQFPDIVVTQDYGLAAMCLARGASALNQNGLIYTPDNIDALLNSRYETKKIRMAGGRIKGPQKRRPEQNEEFEKAIEKMIGE